MELKDNIVNNMREYPSISRNKLDVYNHLFLTNGNGYDWVDGELIEEHDKRLDVISIEEAIDKLFNNEYRIGVTTDRICSILELNNKGEKVVKEYLQYNLERYARDVKTIINAEKAVNQNLFEIEPISSLNGIEPECTLYPLSKYSKIMNIPDDIKSDWLAGINELMYYLLNSEFPSVVEYRTKFENELNQVMERIENLGKMNILTLYNRISSWKEDTMNFKITDVFSWRGSYDKPACSIECVPATKDENLKMLISLTTEEFYGWKGGEYEYTQFDEIHFEPGHGEWSNGQYLADFLSNNSHEPIVQHIFRQPHQL